MIKSVLIGGLFGGLAMFVWGAVSWMVLPWHDATIEKFSNEYIVARDVTRFAPESGIYILPNTHKFPDGMSEADREKAMDSGMKKMKQGPFLFVSVSLDGADPEDPKAFIISILINVAAACLIAWLILQSKFTSYADRMKFVAVAGVLIAILATLPMWNWWKFPAAYTLVNFVDIVITVVIAGLVICKLVKPATSQNRN